MKFSLAISHTPWVPERLASMRRLYTQIEADITGKKPRVIYEEFADKEPNHVWSEKMWKWATEQDVQWCVFLQDDAVVSPSFFDDLDTITGYCCDTPFAYSVVGLQVAHPAAVALAADGFTGFLTHDGLVGVGYAIKREALVLFLDWRANQLKEGVVENVGEDTLLGLWCALTGTCVYHPIPTIVDHDTTIPSTYDNGSHPNRHSRVRWDTVLPNRELNLRVPHMGCFYQATLPMLKEVTKNPDAQVLRQIASENGHRELRRLTYLRRARSIEAKAKIFIATPTRGGVSPSFAASIWRILQDEEIDVEGGLELSDVQQWGEDVVRIRSRFVSHFLTKTDATHLLFIDSDIEVLPKVIRGMLSANKEFVCAPYPRRDGVDFKRVRENSSIPAEALAYRYSVRIGVNGISVTDDGCTEVEGMPLGCALIERKALQEMYDAYQPVLAFDEEMHGESVALFQLILRDRALLSEDYSFCERWRTMGKSVFMFLGEGSPVTHHGEHRYAGNLEAFGLRRQ